MTNIKSGDFASFERKRSGDFADKRIFETLKIQHITLIFRGKALSLLPKFVTSDSFRKYMIVNRSKYIDQLVRSKGNGLIKIVTGLRRSGKSFLLKKLFRQHLLDEGVAEDHIIIIDMESRKNKNFKDPDFFA